MESRDARGRQWERVTRSAPARESKKTIRRTRFNLGQALIQHRHLLAQPTTVGSQRIHFCPTSIVRFSSSPSPSKDLTALDIPNHLANAFDTRQLLSTLFRLSVGTWHDQTLAHTANRQPHHLSSEVCNPAEIVRDRDTNEGDRRGCQRGNRVGD